MSIVDSISTEFVYCFGIIGISLIILETHKITHRERTIE